MSWKLSWELAVEFNSIKTDNSIKSSLKREILNLIGCKIESKINKREHILFRQGESTPVTHLIYTMCAYETWTGKPCSFRWFETTDLLDSLETIWRWSCKPVLLLSVILIKLISTNINVYGVLVWGIFFLFFFAFKKRFQSTEQVAASWFWKGDNLSAQVEEVIWNIQIEDNHLFIGEY